jgi:hypothetical protein
MDDSQPQDFTLNFLRDEYEYLTRLLIDNEKLGESRVKFFISLASAVITAAGLSGLTDFQNIIPGLHGWGGVRLVLIVIFLAISAIIPFGILTLTRIIHRNIDTDNYKEKLDQIRKYFINISGDKKIIRYLAFNPYEGKQSREKSDIKELLGKGGFAETVLLINSALSALLPSLA